MAPSSSVEDADALDCGVCFLPLKPPIFQSQLYLTIRMYITLLLASLMDDLLWSMLMTNARSVKWATSCARRDKLKATGKCHHVCGVATGIYRLCHAMERPVESARVACPNAAYGCAARPAYYEQQAHRQFFIGPTEALLDHFTGVHGWPCSTKVRTGEMSSVRLKDG
ncbi:uncharacterized protein LOC112885107 [Panicum hallii]|uniref:uncharacterized protein LOC112885107 n=1 Tax=Panicum hallii TaxID=206008 RepID=UPI000DF4D00F|nr:uncharacterized protein LOC112885107 [Panicum hallii]